MLLVMPASLVTAQSDTSAVMFNIPERASALRCRLLSEQGAQSSRGPFHFQYQLGEGPQEDEHVIDAVFDSTGRPVFMTESYVSSMNARTPRVEGAGARFDSAGTIIFGFHRIETSELLRRGSHSDSVAAPATTVRSFPPLTEVEKSRLQSFVNWLWAHRCQSG
jgi:hypothetical protein